MAKLNGLARLIKASRSTSPESIFLNELTRTIEVLDENREPSKSYKPSSVGGCLRNMYYQMVGGTLDGTPTEYGLIGICESGSSRHETLQTYVSKMNSLGFDWEWVDVAKYIEEYKPPGTKVIKQSGMETKCFNEIFNMSFLCDGVIKHKGQYYVLEIKTESSYKFSNHDAPFKEHIYQATCYSMCFGINSVIFLYENRDNCSKKAFLVEVTDAMKEEVADKIFTCDDYVATLTPPPKTTESKHCQYCNYKKLCREDGEWTMENSLKKTSRTPSKNTKGLGF